MPQFAFTKMCIGILSYYNIVVIVIHYYDNVATWQNEKSDSNLIAEGLSLALLKINKTT